MHIQNKAVPLQPQLRTRSRAFSSAGSEHLPYKQRVGGSNPSTPTPNFFSFFNWLLGRLAQLVQDGIYVNQSDYDQSPKAVDSQVGTIKFHDVNDDKQITYGDDESGDKAEIGNPLPKFTFGLTNNFELLNSFS